MTKIPSCKKCHSKKVVPILYGRHTHEAFKKIREGKAEDGTCFVYEGMPNWRCKKCGYGW